MKALLPLTCLVVSLASPPIEGTRQDPDKSAERAEALQEGDALLARRQFEPALNAFKRANALANKTSPEAHFGMARAYQGMGAHKNAVDSCTDALKYLRDDKRLEAGIRNTRGVSRFALIQNPKHKALKDAEDDFRAVLALTDALPIARYNLGVVLLKQERDDEGIRELNHFVELAPRSPEAPSARRMAQNPRRAREAFAPDFSIVTLAGEHITLDDVRGKVVLLDFWATWCAPCLAATPSLVRLQKKYASQPFVMLGISVDRDLNPLRHYVDKYKMEWPQYFDDRRTLSRLFEVNGFPTYIVLDHEGLIRATRSGWGPGTAAWLDDEIRRHVKAVPAGALTEAGGR